MFESKRERELRRQAEARRVQIAKRAACRSSMRSIAVNERMMRASIEENRRKAIEAENNGNHARAVSYAKLARQLETQLNVSGDMRSTVEAAYAMNENAAAFGQILHSTGEMMRGMESMTDLDALSAAQLDVEMAREQLEINAGYCEDFLSDAYPEHESCADPVGETELARIMNTNPHNDRLRILEDTNERLNRRCRVQETGKP